MAGYPRSDLDADTWQTITPDDWSWLDHVKAAGSDTGNALSNLGQNLIEALSPFAPNAARAGQPSLQVPPMISGLADSYMRLAGTPSKPGNAYDLTGVRELDASIQQDMSNVLLSLYGGQTVGSLGKGKAATAALPMDEASRLARARELGFDVDNPVYHGSRNNPKPFKEFDLSKIGKGTDYGWFGEGVYTTPSEYRAGNYAGETGHVRSMYGRMENPFDWHAATAQGPDALRELGLDLRSVPQAEKGARITETLKGAGYDGVNIYYPGSRAADERLFFDANQLRDMNAAFDPARSGEAGLLLSDTGKPSLLGRALATAGELPMDHASRLARAREMGFDTEKTWYHGTWDDIQEIDQNKFGSRFRQDADRGGFISTSNPDVAEYYARTTHGMDENLPLMPNDVQGVIYPLRTRATNPLVADRQFISDNFPNLMPDIEHGDGGQVSLWDNAGRYLTGMAKERGHDAVIVRGSDGSLQSTFDPSNIRSVNAAFDPAKADSANLLAAKVGGVPQPQDDTPPWLQDILNTYR